MFSDKGGSFEMFCIRSREREATNQERDSSDGKDNIFGNPIRSLKQRLHTRPRSKGFINTNTKLLGFLRQRQSYTMIARKSHGTHSPSYRFTRLAKDLYFYQISPKYLRNIVRNIHEILFEMFMEYYSTRLEYLQIKLL